MSSCQLESATDDIFNELVFDETLHLIFDVHRAAKKGYLFVTDHHTDVSSNKPNHLKRDICIEPGKDVFGHQLIKVKKYTEDIVCPSCHRQISANRFAPHLEKCLGKGRSSSRIASQKITSSAIESALLRRDSIDAEVPDLIDHDWKDKKKKRGGKKKDKGQAKRAAKYTSTPPPLTQQQSSHTNVDIATF